MNTRSRYPRLIPSFQPPITRTSPQNTIETTKSKDAIKLEAAVDQLIQPFMQECLPDTIEALLQQQRYQCFSTTPKKAPEWRSFNGITGSWLECGASRVREVAEKALNARAELVVLKLHQLEKSIAAGSFPDKAELLQLIQRRREWLRANTAGEASRTEVQKILTKHSKTAAPPPAPIEDVFATCGQGCFQINDDGWHCLSNDEAAGKNQIAFVTGRVPMQPKPIPNKADSDSEEAALFCHLFGRALYRNRHHESPVVLQVVGERAKEARRKILALGGGYVECLDVSSTAFSNRRLHFPRHTRIALLDLEGVSHHTTMKALRHLLALESHPLPIVLTERDLTPLRLPPTTKLLYIEADGVVGSIKHEALLPAAVACERPGEVPTATKVRNRVLSGLLQRWLEERHITPHQEDTDPPQEQQTVPLKDVVKELKRSSWTASFPSLSPTQRELSVELERLGVTITNHSNTLMVKFC